MSQTPTTAPGAPPSAGKILWIALFRGIGDAVLFSPALKKCRELFPDARIDVLLRGRPQAEVLEQFGFCGNILFLPPRRGSLPGFILRQGMWSYDLVFDATSDEQLHLSRWLALAFSRRARVGYDYGSSSFLYTRRLDTMPIGVAHEKDIYGGLLGPFGGPPQLELEAPKPVPAGCLDSLALPPGPGPLVVLHPGGRDALERFEKRWPVERYVEMARRLLADTDARIAIVGSAAEAPWVAENFRPLASDPRLVNLAGRTGIPQLIGILRAAHLFVGNNSGPMHLAAACRVPVITFAGGIPLRRWGPQPEQGQVILGLDQRCADCPEYQCDRQGRPCLEAIRVEETLESVMDQLRPCPPN